MSAYITTGTSPSPIHITPLGAHIQGGLTKHKAAIISALQYKIIDAERTPVANPDHLMGCLAFRHACSDDIFEQECARIGRPELGRRQ